MAYPIEHDPVGSRLTAMAEGRSGQLLYRVRDGVMAILYTEVPEPIAGRGIAADMTRAALEIARRNGWRVRPACSYAADFFDRHPEYADLLA